VLELEGELIVLVEEVVDFCKDSTPLLLGLWENTEDGFEALTVELRLVVEVLENERQLLSLGHASDREVEPGAIAVLLIGRSIVGHPQPKLVSSGASAHF
jgi:hypothetical protein